jgi:hypothetical protein
MVLMQAYLDQPAFLGREGWEFRQARVEIVLEA